MLIAAAVLWRKRKSLASASSRRRPRTASRPCSSGLTISAVELPTAFPYFAAIAAIVDSGFGADSHLIALALYNVAFVLPLILMIIVLLMVAPRPRRGRHRGARDWLQRHWPALLAVLALVAGVFVTAARSHGPRQRPAQHGRSPVEESSGARSTTEAAGRADSGR